MVIGVDGHVAPQRHVVRHAVVRLEMRPLLVLEDDAWQTSRGAVYAQPSHLAAPVLGLLAAIGEVDEALPFHQRSRTYRMPFSTCGLSRGARTRAGSRSRPRAWLYSTNARVGRGLSASGPATAAGKLSRIRRTGRPPKKRHACSNPSIVASTVCCTSGQKKAYRLYTSTTSRPYTTWRLPVIGIDQRAELAEIHLGDFAWGRRRHAHRRARLLPQPSLAHVAPQRRVLHLARDAAYPELLNAGEQQVVLVEPGGDLVTVRL